MNPNRNRFARVNTVANGVFVKGINTRTGIVLSSEVKSHVRETDMLGQWRMQDFIQEGVERPPLSSNKLPNILLI